MRRMGGLRFVPLWVTLVGCGGGDLPGHYWRLNATTGDDGCNTSTQYAEEFDYRLEIDVSTVSVAIGPDTFAEGQIDGCTVTYDSIVWTEVRPAGNIQWTLTGEATAQRGDGACGISTDWIGTETFLVLSSEDPAISPGCTYTLNLSGTYEGEVE